MTSGSEIRGKALLLALALLLPAAALAGGSVMHRGDLTLASGSTVEDVVVADGNLVIGGEVAGSVFVVSGDVLMNPGSRVEGNVTVLGGSLWVSKGAGVDGEVNVFSGQAHVEEGAQVGSEVRALEEVSSLTPEKLALVSRYILFDRSVPPDSFPLSGLSALDLSELHLKKVKDQAMVRLDLFELGGMPLTPEEVEDSRELVFRGRDMRVRVCAVRFSSDKAAADFWDKLRESYERRSDYSVHNSMGEGAHWFFRHRGSSYCLWMNGRTFMAVMVRSDDTSPGNKGWDRIELVRDRTIRGLKDLYVSKGE